MRRRKGISLIETLVAMALSVLLLILISDLFIQTRHAYRLENNTAQLSMSSEAALSRMNTIIRQGVSVEQTYSTYSSGADSIIVKLATINTAGQVLPATYDYIVFRRNPSDTTELEEIVIADTNSRRSSRTRTIAQHLTAFSLVYSNASGATLASTAVATTKKVKVSLTTTEQSYDDTVSTSHSEQIVLRNK